MAAFVAETVRAGLESIPRNQFESGLALGMTSRQVMLKIVMPQAVRNMIPNLMGLYITELKNSSLTSIIAVNELLHRSNILISETFRTLEIYTTVAVVYLIIILPLVYLSRRIEHRLTRWTNQHLGWTMKSAISIQNISKKFGAHEVLRDISFDVPTGTKFWLLSDQAVRAKLRFCVV